jgi:hypothetical protein
MRNLLKVTFLFCLSGSIAHAQEVIDLNKTMKCGKAEFVMNHFVSEYGERPLWVGKEMSGSHITLLVNKENKTWTLVQYDSNLACVLGAGETSSSNEVF